MKKLLLFLFITLNFSVHAQDINQCGLDDNALLTDAEAAYLNHYAQGQINGFDLHGKKVLFLSNSLSELPKTYYFQLRRGLHAKMLPIVTILTDEEKAQSGGYDAFATNPKKISISTKKVISNIRQGKLGKITPPKPNLHLTQQDKERLNQCGLDDNPVLTDAEAQFLTNYFTDTEKNGFDFTDKKILVLGGSGGSSLNGKTQYFKDISLWMQSYNRKISTSIHPLTPEQKVQSGGYDVLLTRWVKVPITDRKLKKIIKKINKGKWIVPVI